MHDRDAVARCLIALLPALPAGVPLLAAGAPEALRAVEELCGDRTVVALGPDIVAGWNAATAQWI